MNIEDELKELINSRYKSVRQFAIEIDLPYTTVVGMLERGIGNAGIQKVIKMCQALGIDTDALAEGRIEERKVNDEAVTFREKDLLKKYRSIDISGKSTIDNVINDLYSRCTVDLKEPYPTGYKDIIGFTDILNAKNFLDSNRIVYSASLNGEEMTENEIIALANEVYKNKNIGK